MYFCRILTVIERFTELIDPSVNYTSTSFATTARDILTTAQQPVSFNSSQLLSGAMASITIPYNSLKDLISSQSVRVTHTIYLNDTLFRSPLPVQLDSIVLSTSVVGATRVNNLSEPITLVFSKASRVI